MKLGPTPPAGRDRELWLQHAAGYILFRDVRDAALERLSDELNPAERVAATQAVDAAVYALMQVLDGVTGGLTDGPRRVKLATTVSLIEDGEIIESLDLFDGDGMCMGFHMWRAGDFGESPVTSAT
ncbi:MAG: hypothetical protein KBG28_19145 [Kofleriaceae bacterium]|nr:hypothetical protein [Kofleriaceae bacterium]MBP6836315.1 hypothetical protein [Kofleriaceae bacterium]MBP9206098.1 hypothetical protein [Kofleriaceae bacterium]